MVEGASETRHSFGLRTVNHFRCPRKQTGCRDLCTLGVTGTQVRRRICERNNAAVRTLQRSVQKSADVPVYQARDSDAKWTILLCLSAGDRGTGKKKVSAGN